MEYTIKKLANLSGVTTRTLRYYDEIELLKPANINSSGYRVYTEKEVDLLQQILFYRELGLSLNKIKEIITSPSFNKMSALKDHYKNLIKKRNQLDILISNVEKSISSIERKEKMSDKEKFEGFKKEIIKENENKYGKEIREKYGNEMVEQSYQKFSNMTKEQYEEASNLEKELIAVLKEALKTGNAASDLAQKAASLHHQWLSYYWPSYSKEAHRGVVQMYVDDERFTSYYDKHEPGMAKFLRDAVFIYTKIDK